MRRTGAPGAFADKVIIPDIPFTEAALPPDLGRCPPWAAGLFVVKWVRVSLFDLPDYHGNRSPWKNQTRRNALNGHLRRRGGFDLSIMDPLVGNLNSKTGRINIICGAGRWWMAEQQKDRPVTSLPVRLAVDLSYEKERDWYKWDLKERTKGSPLDEWLADRGTNEMTDKIMTCVEKNKFEITGGRKAAKGHHISLNACVLAWYMGDETTDVLDLVLNHVKNTSWGSSPNVTSTHMAFLAVLIGRNRAVFRTKNASDRLRETMNGMTPGALHKDAFSNAADREIRKAQPRHLAWLMGGPFLETKKIGYNARLGAANKIKSSSLVFEWPKDHQDYKRLRDVYWPYPPKPDTDD